MLLVREYIDTSGGLAHRVAITRHRARSSLGEFSWVVAGCDNRLSLTAKKSPETGAGHDLASKTVGETADNP